MIFYEVQREDILKASTFKWAKVLQFKYDCTNFNTINKEFYEYIKEIKSKVLYNSIAMQEANTLIYQKVAALTEKYPNDFPNTAELGWYSKQLLIDRFIAGEVTINDTYTVNTMLSHRLLLLEQVKAETHRRELLAEQTRLKKIEEERMREESRIPIKVGMLFRTKAGIAKAFVHQYPSGTKMSCIQSELPSALVLEHGKHCNGRKSWKVIEILIEGGLAYSDDILQWENKDE